MKIDWLVVLRDVLLVASLGALGTILILALLGGAGPGIQFLLAFVMLSVGFTISGCLRGTGRMRHLSIVALGVLLVVLLDGVLRQPERVPGILVVGTLTTLVAMLTGAGLSLVFRRSSSESASPVE